MAPRVNLPAVEPHVINPMAAMLIVIVHHIAKVAAKMIEPVIVRRIGRFQTQMPFTHNRRVIAGGLQDLRQKHRMRRDISPVALNMRTDNTRHTNQIGVSSRKQRRPCRRAHRTVGIEVIHPQPGID